MAVLVVFALVYFLPSMVALAGGRDPGVAIVINLFLGWTMVGWVVALALACRRQIEPVEIHPQTIVLASPGTALPPPLTRMPPAGWYPDPSTMGRSERYWNGAAWMDATRGVPRRLPR